MKRYSVILLFTAIVSCSNTAEKNYASQTVSFDAIRLSIQLLESIKSNNKDTDMIMHILSKMHPDSLAVQLKNDNQKKAFWINIYNAYIQIILKENPELYESRNSFFSNKRVTIAQRELSFDDIEHGIIRSSRVKLAMGFLEDPFADEFEKKFRTQNLDNRIHFALNCGAKSCPPISIYHPNTIDQQLDENAKYFLQMESSFDEENKVLNTSVLFSWFRGDFGTKKDLINLLEKYNVIEKNTYPEIKYNNYNWTLDLANYYEK